MELEQIYEDKKCWIYFEGETEDETICVYCRCPKCGRYLKYGELLMNMIGEIELTKFVCKKHGEIEPYCERIYEDY